MPIYYTHDNGGRPFKVVVNSTQHSLQVFKIDHDSTGEGKDVYFKKPCYSTLYKSIKIGKHIEPGTSKGWGTGNSILVEVKPYQYVHIGAKIISFKTTETITQFKSPVGNNDVPYPYACSKNYVYLLIESMVLLKKDIPKMKDPYDFYYFSYERAKVKPDIKVKALRTKTVVKRTW